MQNGFGIAAPLAVRADTTASDWYWTDGLHYRPGDGGRIISLELLNDTDRAFHGVLTLSTAVVRQLDWLAEGRDGGDSLLLHYTNTGPWPFPTAYRSLDVDLARGQRQWVGLRVDFGFNVGEARVHLYKRAAFVATNQREQLVDGFVLGLSLLNLLITAIFARIVRRRFFVWAAIYAGLLFVICVFQAMLPVWWLSWSRWANDTVIVGGAIVSAAILPVLFLHYVEWTKTIRWLKKSLWGTLPLLVGFLLTFAFRDRVADVYLGVPAMKPLFRVFGLVSVGYLAALAVMGYHLLRKPGVDTLLFLLAYGGFLLPSLVNLLVSNGYLPMDISSKSAFGAAIVWQIGLLAIVLFRRISNYYQHSRRLAEAEAEARRESEFRQAKNRLYSNISHEFRTPLTIIRGLVGRLAAAPEDLALINRHNDALLDLVDQLLELDRLDDHRLIPVFTPGDLGDFLRGIVYEFQPLATERRIELTFAAPKVETAVAERFWRRILVNLLGNALKFTPPGGRVDVTMTATDDCLKLTVTDTGVGMNEAERDRVFERFYQTGEDRRGTGIGLALVRELVTRLKGKISVASDVGAGTTFIVQVARPPKLAFGPGKAEAQVQRELTKGGAGRPLIRLVITDPGLRAFLRGCLAERFRLTDEADPTAFARLTELPDGGLGVFCSGENAPAAELTPPVREDDLLLEVGLLLRRR